MASLNNSAYSLIAIVFLIAWCSGDNKKDKVSDNETSTATANLTTPATKPVAQAVSHAATQEWQQMVKQANQEAAKKGLVSSQISKKPSKPQPPPNAPPVVVVSPSNQSPSYSSSFRGSGGYRGCNGREINVRGYYRKDGTYVQPHTRCR